MSEEETEGPRRSKGSDAFWVWGGWALPGKQEPC